MAKLAERITVDPEQCGGRPCIRGLRVRVTDVLDLLAAGLTSSQILEELPYLEPADIQAALQYASRELDHPVLCREVTVWIDAQLSPALAYWLAGRFGVEAI